MLSFENVSYAYDSTHQVFNNINCTIKKNSFTVVIGMNGSGKSTFAKLSSGVLQSQNGVIRYNNKTLKKTKIGYLQQKKNFGEHMLFSVFEFVLMGTMHPKKLFFTKQDSALVLEKIKICGLLEKKDIVLHKLSGGQIQRSLIARMLVSEPELIVLDEPFESLDIEASKVLFEQLQTLKSTSTIIMVSHNEQMVSDLADAIFCISNNHKHHDFIESFCIKQDIPITHICS